jgi:hypothetical protein
MLLTLGSFTLVAASCKSTPPPPPPPTFQTTATIKDIMDSLVDPSADVLWDAVATTVSAAGIDEKRPRTEEEWKTVRRSAIALVEATNLLLMEGRHVARPGEKAEDEQVELAPEQIESMLAADRTTWVGFVRGLHDAAMPALNAIDQKNAEALLNAGEGIDQACENCHLKYWYPNDKQAEKAREGAANPRK